MSKEKTTEENETKAECNCKENTPQEALKPLPLHLPSNQNYYYASPQERGLTFSISLDWFELCLLGGFIIGFLIEIKRRK